MIDTGSAKWDFSKEERYVIDWFNENGFDGKLEKQYVNKTIFTITKEGVTDKFELPRGVIFKSISNYMKQFENYWELFCELQQLRKEVQK